MLVKKEKLMTIEEKYNWSKVYMPYTVEEMRILAAKHGMDISVIVGYNEKENVYNIITVGKNKEYADQAVELSKQIMETVNPNNKESELLEDRRNEHDVIGSNLGDIPSCGMSLD